MWGSKGQSSPAQRKRLHHWPLINKECLFDLLDLSLVGLVTGVRRVTTCLTLYLSVSCDQRVPETEYHHAERGNLLRGRGHVRKIRSCQKRRSDDDTYVRDAKQTELHHACRTKRRNEKLCRIKDSLFPPGAAQIESAPTNVRKTPLMSDYQLQGRQPSLIMTSRFYPKENIYRICWNVPIMDLYNWSQLALLSPSQCPAHFPLEG